MENSGKSVIASGSGEGDCAEVKKPKMRLERKRTRKEELKMLSDLSTLQNLAAMLEAETFRKRKKRKRKKKNKKATIEAGAQEIATVNVGKEEEQVDSVTDVESYNSLVKDSVHVEPQKPLVDAADEDKANTVTAVETTESFEAKPVEISEKYVVEKVDAAYENDANAIIGVETAESFETCLMKKSEESLLEKADATYQNMAKTVIDVETATSFRTRPEAKSVLAKVDAVYENKAKTIIDVETTDSFRTGSVAKSVLEKVDAGCENKAKSVIIVETADLFETRPAEKPVLEKILVDAGYEDEANTVKYVEPAESFKTRMVEKSEESVLEKVDAGCENKAKSVIIVETADSFETKPAEKSVMEKVDAGYEDQENTVKYVEPAESFKTRMVEKSEESVLEKVDAAYENKANTVINVEPVESLQTSPVEKSEGLSLTIGEERALQKAKRSCWKNDEVMCSSDEFKIISDLSNFKNLAAMMKAEAIMRQRKIERRRKKKRKIEFQAQDELSVQKVKAGAQADKIDIVEMRKASDIESVEMRKASDTESVSVTKSIPTEELLVSNFKIDEEMIPEEAKQNCKKTTEVMSYLDEFKMISDLSNFKNLAAMMEAEASMRCKKRKKRRKKNRGIEFEMPLQINVNSMKEHKPVDTWKNADKVKLFDVKNNIVQQRLCRARRYFETPESSWRMCDNYRKGGHTAVCCSAENQKPCCLCGSFKHSGHHCNQAPKCVVHERSNHTKSSPEKNQGNCSSSIICLRCGGSGHDMFSCRNEYFSDDLKEIQCYVCKRFGHLCCVDAPSLMQPIWSLEFWSAKVTSPAHCDCCRLDVGRDGPRFRIKLRTGGGSRSFCDICWTMGDPHFQLPALSYL